jgi:hypothetical protein
MRGHRSKRRLGSVLGGAMLASHLALSGAGASAQQAPAPKPPAPAPAQSSGLDALVYVPHDYDAPEVTETGGARGAGQAGTELPELLVLAPPKLAATASVQPTLYWYISGPSSAPLRVTLLDLESTAAEPLLEVGLPPAPAAGIYGMPLAEHSVELEPGHRYEWSVALEIDEESYSNEPVAKTVLAVEEPDPALAAKLTEASPLARFGALAAAGYWYDALDLLGQQIAAEDPSEPWRELRAHLLDQVGLQQVAAYDQTDGRAP